MIDECDHYWDPQPGCGSARCVHCGAWEHEVPEEERQGYEPPRPPRPHVPTIYEDDAYGYYNEDWINAPRDEPSFIDDGSREYVEDAANACIEEMLNDLESGKTRKCPCGSVWKPRTGRHGPFWYCGNGHTISRSSVARRRRS